LFTDDASGEVCKMLNELVKLIIAHAWLGLLFFLQMQLDEFKQLLPCV